MKITVLGGTGLVGARVVTRLADLGNRVTAASLSTGVGLATGAGLDAALVDTGIVPDVSGRPVTAGTEHAARHARSGDIIRQAIRSSDVRHHVLLSADGTDRLATSGFFLGKLVRQWNRSRPRAREARSGMQTASD